VKPPIHGRFPPTSFSPLLFPPIWSSMVAFPIRVFQLENYTNSVSFSRCNCPVLPFRPLSSTPAFVPPPSPTPPAPEFYEYCTPCWLTMLCFKTRLLEQYFLFSTNRRASVWSVRTPPLLPPHYSSIFTAPTFSPIWLALIQNLI